MAKRKILTVGFEVCSEATKYQDFNTEVSLLDWDIILIKPDISEMVSYLETYQGKPCLSDDASFRLKEKVEHWRREILDAVGSGKSVFVYLSEFVEVFIATGERTYSGTGRNQKTTRMVTSYNNYIAIPAEINPVKTNGKEMKISTVHGDLFKTYWQEFCSISRYKVVLGSCKSPCFLTKHGDKPVGAIYRPKNSSGALVLLPNIDFYPDEFFKGDEWSKKAEEFGSKFVKAIVAIDKSLKNRGELTPEPEWAKTTVFKLKVENKLASDLLKLESELEKIQKKKELLIDQLNNAGILRHLLYEKGKPLENAILEALKLLGFAVSQYNDGKSEFDAVFESKEGRLIGEAEGKDSKPINIDKLRQLALNIHEDFDRDDVETPAKPVLFGNAYRLKPIGEREETFTIKCKTAAQTSSTALVSTTDLFNAAKYLADKKNASFATKCRKAIFNTVGQVIFPEVPKKEIAEVSSETDKI